MRGKYACIRSYTTIDERCKRERVSHEAGREQGKETHLHLALPSPSLPTLPPCVLAELYTLPCFLGRLFRLRRPAPPREFGRDARIEVWVRRPLENDVDAEVDAGGKEREHATALRVV